MIAEHTLERLASGHTHLMLRFSFRGILAPLVGRLNRSFVNSYIATEAESLRRASETSSPTTQGTAAEPGG